MGLAKSSAPRQNWQIKAEVDNYNHGWASSGNSNGAFSNNNGVDDHAPATQHHDLMSPTFRTSCVTTKTSVAYQAARPQSTRLSASK